MTYLRTLLLTFLAAVTLAVPVSGQSDLPAPTAASEIAQETDAGFLERTIQSALGGDGREVRITGLDGALSSEISIARIEVLDDAGVWLTVSGVELSWKRLALLRKRVDIEHLTVAAIDLRRTPQPRPKPAPSIEAAPPEPFRLPDLPVEVAVGQIMVSRLDLGAPVLGQAARLSLDGSANLVAGLGKVQLDLQRIDGPSGHVSVRAGFDANLQTLGLDLSVTEDAGGLISTLARLHNAPSLEARIKGDGPLSAFVADLSLSTEAVERLAGTVRITQSTEDPLAGTQVAAHVAGDLSTLFAPAYRDFFGTDVHLDILAQHTAGVETRIDQVSLGSRSLALEGRMALGPSGLPTFVDLVGDIRDPSAEVVTLPLPGPQMSIGSSALVVAFDASAANDFVAHATIEQFVREDLTFDRARVSLNGALRTRPDPFGLRDLSAVMRADVLGLDVGATTPEAAPDDALSLTAAVAYDPQAQTASLSDMSLVFGDLRLHGDVAATGLAERPVITAQTQIATGDLARLAALTGRALSGRFEGTASARIAPVDAQQDITLTGSAKDLSIGHPRVDPFLAGRSVLTLEARRDTSGITLRNLDLTNDQIKVSGTGALTSQSGALDAQAHLSNAALLAPQLSGPAFLSIMAQGDLPHLTLEATVGGTAVTDHLGDLATLSADVIYTPQQNDIALPRLSVRAGDLRVEGTAEVTGARTAPAASVDVTVDTGDLARFDTLLAMPMRGHLAADVVATATSDTGFFDIALTGQAQDVEIGHPVMDPLLDAHTDLTIRAKRDDSGIVLDALELRNPQIQARGAGLFDGDIAALDLTANLTEASLIAPHLSGPLALTAQANGVAPRYDVRMDIGDTAITDVLGAPARLSADMLFVAQEHRLDVHELRLILGDLLATGTVGAQWRDPVPSAQVNLNLMTGDLSRLAPLVDRPLRGQMLADVAGTYAAQGFTATATVIGTDVAIGVPQVDQILDGDSVVQASVQGRGAVVTVDSVTVETPELSLDVDGTISPEQSELALRSRLRNLGVFVPQLSGPLRTEALALRKGQDPWTVSLEARGPEGLTADVSGTISPARQDLVVDATLGNLGAFVAEIPGRVRVSGTVNGQNQVYSVNLGLAGPANITSDISGRVVGADGTMDLALVGSVPLAIADGFITPRTLNGAARLNLRLSGQPSLEALSGQISVAGGRFSDPNSGQALEDITLDLTVASARADLDAVAKLATGGRLQLSGPVDLTDRLPGALELVLEDLTVVDPQLYTIDLGGRITMTGALADDAVIDGDILIDRAEIKIPDVGGNIGDIPTIIHVNEPDQSRAARQKAGLIQKDETTAKTSKTAYPLRLGINAPARVFVRGRGLDTEFGGQIEVTGTTASPAPTGFFELIRGRLNILNRLLVFTDADITLGGDLRPDIYMVAVSQNAPIEAKIQITGPIDDPELTLSSSSPLSEDEVLSQLFFGKPLSQLSPLELAGLASAISTLSGDGGGLMGRIRNGLGVDQLSVGTDETGAASVTAGRYLTDDVYTDVTVNAQGESRIQLNYSVSPSVTLRSGFSSTGDARLGVGLEKDY